MNRRISAYLICVAMLLSMLGVPVFPAAAESAYHTIGEMAYYPDERVFLIESEADLQTLAHTVNAGYTLEGYTFLQTEDIVLTGAFTPIGKNPNNGVDASGGAMWFKGTYDGRRHTISNLQIQSSANGVGLFGACSGAVIMNLGIESGSVTGGNRAGGIAGYADGCTVLNCYNKADITITSGADGAGGIAGVARSGAKLYGCANFGAIRGTSVAGGLCGWGASDIKALNCFNSGSVQVDQGGASLPVDPISRFSSSYSPDFSSCMALRSACSAAHGGTQLVDSIEAITIARLLNRGSGEDTGCFTVNSSGELIFATGDSPAILEVRQRIMVDGVLLETVPFYLSGGFYTVPGDYQYAGVLYAVMSGATYFAGDEIPIEGDAEITLYVEGEIPAAGEIAALPDVEIFKVSTVAELAEMSARVAEGYTYAGKKVFVTADLDFTGYASWAPIGYVSSSASGVPAEGSFAFSGTFDGQCHHFKNMEFAQTGDYQGLFAYVEGGTLRNIVFDEGGVTATGSRLGVLCSLLRNSTVSDIENHLNAASTDTSASLNVSIVSLALKSTLKNMVNYGAMGLENSSSVQENAGICGWGFSNSSILNCFNAGTIYGSASEQIARGAAPAGSYYLLRNGEGTMSWETFFSLEPAWILNSNQGAAANSGLWAAGGQGPVLNASAAAYRAALVLLDQSGAQIGEGAQYFCAGELFAAPVCAGYRFLNAECNRAPLAAGTALQAKDITVYAYFEPLTFEITYELNGGAFTAEHPVSHTSGAVTRLPDAGGVSRAGYGFAGWYENEELTGEAVSELAANCCRNVTLYAAWAEPVIITAPAQLAALAAGDMSGYYKLGADLDMDDTLFTPIGTYDAPFTGIFDGNGHVIRNLSVSSTGSFVGLIGCNAGLIENVTLDDSCYFGGDSYVGALAGYNAGAVRNCVSYAEVAAAEADAQTYRMMSQNLCIWGSGDFAPAARMPYMLQRIQNEMPDIIGMQEGSEAWVNYLQENLPAIGYSLIYRYRSDKESTPVAYNTERFDLIDSGTFWLSETPEKASKGWDASHYRVCTWVILRNKSNGERIGLYNTHLDVGGAVARREGAKLVKERMLQAMDQYPGIMLFSSGDYNTNEGSAPYVVLTTDGFGDARYLAEVSTDMDTYSADLTENWINAATSKIDFLITYASAVRVLAFKVLAECTPGGTRLSDHNGTEADFTGIHNLYVGGAVGANAGTLAQVVLFPPVTGESMAGSVAGINTGVMENVYYDLYNVELPAVGAGSDTGVTLMTDELNDTAAFLWALNEAAGLPAFTVEESFPVAAGDHRAIPVRLTLNGIEQYVFSGDVFEIDTAGYADPVCAVNGALIGGSAFIVPAVQTVAVTVQENTPCTVHDFGPWTADETGHTRTCRNNPAHTETEPHTYGAPEQVPATCTSTGYTVRACTVCGYLLRSDEVPATGHRYGAWEAAGNAEHHRVCINDTAHMQVAPHAFNAGEAHAATCLENAYTRYTCADCGYFYDVISAPPLGHAYGAYQSIDEAHHQRVCSRDPSHVQVKEHRWTQKELAATCETEAGTEYTCAECGYIYFSASGAPLGHAYGAWEPMDQTQHKAVCTHDARHVLTAEHTFGAGSVVPPACEQQGYTRYTCTVCGYYYDTDYTPASAHSWCAWEVVTPADGAQPGLMRRTCAACGAEETRVLPGSADPAVIPEAQAAENGLVRVDVRLRNNPGISSLQLVLTYDTAALQIESAGALERGDALPSLLFGTGLEGALNTGCFKATWAGAANDTTNGILFTLTFRIVGAGSTTLDVQVMPEMTLDENIRPIAVYSRDVEIYCGHLHRYVWSDERGAFLCECGAVLEVGDPNRDGLFTVADAVIVLRHLNGEAGNAIDLAAADFTGDGRVSIADAAAILRMLAELGEVASAPLALTASRRAVE